MNATVVISAEVFADALAAAERVDPTDEVVAGLGAPLNAALKGKFAEMWGLVKSALAKAHEVGAEASRAWLDKAVGGVQEILASAGDKAEELRAALAAKLRDFARTIIDGALHDVRDELQVGGVTMTLRQVEIGQTLLIGGSLKSTITELVAMSAEGQITINATYGPASAAA